MNGATREELRELMQQTVCETLTRLGIDVRNPIELQADMRALREWRLLMKAIRKSAIVSLLGLLVTGLGTATWIGIKSFFKKGD